MKIDLFLFILISILETYLISGPSEERKKSEDMNEPKNTGELKVTDTEEKLQAEHSEVEKQGKILSCALAVEQFLVSLWN